MAKRGAKRKPELDLEAERSSYASFVAAANAVSQLYTAGVREQRRTAKATLVRLRERARARAAPPPPCPRRGARAQRPGLHAPAPRPPRARARAR
jgi:hypothetical protein